MTEILGNITMCASTFRRDFFKERRKNLFVVTLLRLEHKFRLYTGEFTF